MASIVFIANPEGEELTGMVKAIEASRYKVVTATDGATASEMLQKEKTPLAIVLNSTLKGKDTLELCKEIKANKKLQIAPIYILEDGKVEKDQYREAGVDDFFARPIRSTFILQKLKSLTVGAVQTAAGGVKLAPWVVPLLILVFICFACYVAYIFYPMMTGQQG